MPNTELNKTFQKLSSISLCAKSDSTFVFTSLAHLLNVEFLKDCFLNLDRNKAVGVDRVNWYEYNRDLDNNLNELVDRLKRKSFKPLPAKRVYIPKDDKELRPLGISTIENKIVECGITRILETIYEADFYNFSYGFRVGKNAHQALKTIGDNINHKQVNHIVEADIKGFFDNVDHNMLIEFLKIRVNDSSLLFLIKRFLKAGYVDNNLLVKNNKGTPQGSILSPILANIYLHYVLDKWFVDVVQNHTTGYCKLVRYADDFIIMCQYEYDANRILRTLYNRFNKYNLKLHPDKTRAFSFGRFERKNAKAQNRKANTFDFLGFTHYCDTTRRGYFKVGRKTSNKKFRKKVKELNMWLKSIRNQVPIKEWWKILSLKLQGHYEYYGISENYKSIYKFYKTAIKLAKKWINRRSQKRVMNWERMKSYLIIFPLPKPSIRHSFYNNSISQCWELN
jgi:group II intron reverse transcriptase/maturase